MPKQISYRPKQSNMRGNWTLPQKKMADAWGGLVAKTKRYLSYITDGLKLYYHFKNTKPTHLLAGSTVFDGSDDYVDVGDIGNIKSLSFWVNADDITSNTDYVIDLNGTDYVKIVNGTITLTGFAGGTNTIYVNGAVSSTLSNAGQWYYISITSDTNRNASDFDIGRVESVGFFDGSLGNVSVDTSALTQSEIQSIMWKNYADLSTSEKTNLVSWWNLHTNFNDSHGSNDGTANGGVAAGTTAYGGASPIKPRIQDNSPDDVKNYGTIYSGTAVSFDGTNDVIKCGTGLGDALGDNYSGALSLSMWFNADVTSGDDGLFGIGGFAGNGEFDVLIYSNNIYGSLNSWGWRQYMSFNDTASWHHLVVIADISGGASACKMYLDGNPQTTSTAGSFPSASDMDFAGLETRIGQYGNNAPAYYFDGKISNVKFFNTNLTEAQVQELYLNPEQILPTGVSSSNLKLYLPMNEGSGTTTYDGSGNQNHGTITGATWDTGNTDIYQTALVRQNKPMVFDGSDDVVTITDINVSYPQLSISVWFYGNTAGGAGHMFGITGVSDTLNVYMTHGGSDTYVFRYGSGTDSISQTSTFTEGEWNHAVFIADSTNNIVKVYKNGTEIQSSAQTFDTPVYGAGFHIGARGTVGSPVNTFKDNINEVAIWDVALDADTVTALYNSGTPLDASADSGNYDNSGDLQGYWRNDGDSTWTDRANTGVASFDGTDDYLQIAHSSELAITGNITLSAWINTTDASGRVLSKEASGYAGVGYFDISSGKIRFRRGNNSNSESQIITDGTYNDGLWHFVTCTASGTTWNIYVDGSLVKTGTDSETVADAGGVLSIGRATGGSSYLAGQIAGTHIFNTALTASEVTELYAIDKRSSISGHSKFSNCVGSWLMGAGSGDTTSTIQDQTSNNNDGTVNGASLVGYNNGTASGSPSTILLPEGNTAGRDTQGFFLTDTTEIKDGIRLNGNEYVDAGDIGSIKSVGFWVKPDTNGENMINCDGGSHTITASAGTISATGFTSPTIYVDGSVSSTLTADTWQFVTVTTSTGFTASDFKTYSDYNGLMDEIFVYSDTLTADEITKNYNHSKSKHS